MRVWRYAPTADPFPDIAEPGYFADARAVLLAAPDDHAAPAAWMVVADYHDGEATLLFRAPVGDHYRVYIRALLAQAIEEARTHGFTSLLAHWRAGWATASDVLDEFGFSETDSGWRRNL